MRVRTQGVREVVAAEAADVDGPEVVGGLAVRDPFGQRHAGAAAGGDAEGVEAGADEEVSHLGGLAEDEVAVGGEALGAVDELLDAGVLERGDAAEGELHDRLEMVPVVVEELEGEVLGDALLGPGPGVGLVAAHDEAADLLLVVGEAVGVAQGGEAGGDAVDLLGDEVLVLDADEGDVDAGRGGELAGPLAGAEDELLAGDAALGGLDAGDAAVLGAGCR